MAACGRKRRCCCSTTPARSPASSRVNPVAYLPDDRRYLIWAANGGAPNNPDWYHNLKAHPNTRIEVGSETIDVVAEEATGAERERLFAKATERYPQLHELARQDPPCHPDDRPHTRREHLSARSNTVSSRVLRRRATMRNGPDCGGASRSVFVGGGGHDRSMSSTHSTTPTR